MISRSSVSRKISFALVVLLCAGTAAAKKRVVVSTFDGKGAYAQAEAQKAVAKSATVISDAAWKRAMKKLKLKSATDSASIAKVAGSLQADGVVFGSVTRTGAEWGLTITVVDGKSGEASDTLSIPLRSYRMDAEAKKAIAAQLAPAIAKLGNEPAVEITPPPATPSAPVAEDTEKAPIHGTLSEAPPVVDTRDTTPTTVVAEPVNDRYSRWSAADVDIGVGMVVRTLDFNAASDLAQAQRPNGYSGSVVPTIVVNGELYPFAFNGERGGLAGLGVGFTVERVLTIKSKFRDTEYDTSQTRFGGGLRYRWNFGSTATSPTLKVLAGINHLDFSIDRGSANLSFPNVAYTYIDLGLGGRIPLGSPTLALFIDARYLQVLSSGEITETAFYGSGGALGFDGEVGFEYIFARRGVVRVGGRYQRIALDFDGNGTLSNNLDGNPATQDVGGATDSFVGAYIAAGYLF